MVINAEKNVPNDMTTGQVNGPASGNQVTTDPNTNRYGFSGNVSNGTQQSNKHYSDVKSGFDDSNSNNSIRIQNDQPVRRYYVDELGFYRYLDTEEKQYVCSNIDVIERKNSKSTLALTTTKSTPNSGTNSDTKNGNSNGNIIRKKISNQGETRLETCFKTLRHDLGISHFDKTEEYESWKSDWDEFMRVKLISQQPVTLNRELKARVRSGIPHDYRCKVWTALIKMRTRNIRAQFGDDIYQVIIRDYVSRVEVPDYGPDDRQNDTNNNNDSDKKSHPNGSSSSRTTSRSNGSSYIASKNNNGISNGRSTRGQGQVDSSEQQQLQGQSTSSPPLIVQDKQMNKCFKQIELDLLRTLPNNRHFEDPNSIGVQRVRRVLRAYACFNQAVGYCQGMNRLAAMALLVLPEEEAFWCLVAIIQCIMPKDYYLKPWLAQVDCCVLSELLEKKMPKLHKHLVNNDIELTLFTWFFTIFVDGFRPELMLRIWDCFLLEGDKVLFRFALSILYITQDDLLKMNDFSTMSLHLSRLVSTRKLDVEHLFETFNAMNPLSNATIETKRDFHRNKIRAMLEF